MRFDSKAWDTQLVTYYGHGSISCERIENKVFFSDSPFSQDLLNPLRRKTGGVAKPPVNGERHVIEKSA
jgi:hypothetical protein